MSISKLPSRSGECAASADVLSRLGLRRPPDLEYLDSPARVLEHRQAIQDRPLLRSVYADFYARLLTAIDGAAEKRVVELGSGGGFLKQVAPSVITSDMVPITGVDMTFSADHMPFADEEVDAFLMLNVFHHLPDAEAALAEIDRCLRPGGRLAMIEPAHTAFARLIYRWVHHEPYHPHGSWRIGGGNPMSDANTALPWIVFSRDRKRFCDRFPRLRIVRIESHSPLKYLLSGGLSGRPLLPAGLNRCVDAVERVLRPFHSHLGLFQTIALRKCG